LQTRAGIFAQAEAHSKGLSCLRSTKATYRLLSTPNWFCAADPPAGSAPRIVRTRSLGSGCSMDRGRRAPVALAALEGSPPKIDEHLDRRHRSSREFDLGTRSTWNFVRGRSRNRDQETRCRCARSRCLTPVERGAGVGVDKSALRHYGACQVGNAETLGCRRRRKQERGRRQGSGQRRCRARLQSRGRPASAAGTSVLLGLMASSHRGGPSAA
jgi:hypothetical protein